MLHVGFQRVAPDKVDRIRAWMAECKRREDEVQATFRQEGMRSEKAWLIHTGNDVLLAYAIEADDVEIAQAAARASTLPIDHEHLAVKGEIDGGPLEIELIWDMVARE